MQRGIDVDTIIKVSHGGTVRDAKVRRIGASSNNNGRAMHHWVMLTLDVGGEAAYAVARDDELASFATDES